MTLLWQQLSQLLGHGFTVRVPNTQKNDLCVFLLPTTQMSELLNELHHGDLPAAAARLGLSASELLEQQAT
jgi:hypothetical protein